MHQFNTPFLWALHSLLDAADRANSWRCYGFDELTKRAHRVKENARARTQKPSLGDLPSHPRACTV